MKSSNAYRFESDYGVKDFFFLNLLGDDSSNHQGVPFATIDSFGLKADLSIVLSDVKSPDPDTVVHQEEFVGSDRVKIQLLYSPLVTRVHCIDSKVDKEQDVSSIFGLNRYGGSFGL